MDLGRLVRCTLALVLLAVLPSACKTESESAPSPDVEQTSGISSGSQEQVQEPSSGQPSSDQTEAVPRSEETASRSPDRPPDSVPGASLGRTGEKEGQPLDIVLVIDNSGSMKQNDPQRLTARVTRTFADKLPPGSRFGIVVFDKEARLVFPLLTVGTPGFGRQVANGLEKLDYAGQRTDIAAGVERGLYELRKAKEADRNKVIVLLTDGLVDVGSVEQNLERGRWLKTYLKDQAAAEGIRIFGIAFTESADFELIQSLAEGTHGEYFRVLTALEISPKFDEIREKITAKKSDVIKDPEPPPPPPEQPVWPMIVVTGILVLGIVAVAAIALQRRRRRSERMPAAYLHDLSGVTSRRSHFLRDPITRIGRVPKDNDIHIPRETISAYHAAVEFRSGVFYVKDLQSTNGTSKNGRNFSSPEEIRESRLKHGDRVKFDEFGFEFSIAAIEKIQPTRFAGDRRSEGTAMRVQPGEPIVPKSQLKWLDQKPKNEERPKGMPAGQDSAAAQSDHRARGRPEPQEVPTGSSEQGKPIQAPPSGWQGGEAAKPKDGDAPSNAAPPSGSVQARRPITPVRFIRNEFCLVHRQSVATETCPVCGKGWCRQCMHDVGGERLCSDCANKQSGKEPDSPGKPGV